MDGPSAPAPLVDASRKTRAGASRQVGDPAAPGQRDPRLRGWGGFLRRMGPVGPMAIAALVLPPLGGLVLLGLLGHVGPLVRGTVWGPVACAAAFSLCGGLALLPTAALSVFAGWAFGFGVGYATGLAGFAGAAAISYAVARYGSGDRVVRAIDDSPRWRAVHRALLGSGAGRTALIVALLRLPTVPPFTATTLALGAMRVAWRPYLLGTVVGVAPRTALYVYLASRAERLDFDAADDWWVLAASVAVGVGVLALITAAARRALARLTEEAAAGGAA